MAFLRAKNIDRIIVLGHGNGGNIAVGLFDKITSAIAGLILIGVPELADEDKKIFSVMQKPILDLYGERDLTGVEQAVLQRKVIMKRGVNNRYVMRKVTGADHFFTGLTSTLVMTIRGWLNVTFIEPKKQN
ncbi:MAG: alpha/beta hydrolase [Gammaproteobacteria bacterium]|nr:alpha/beta hydrolase [Gammaproteobacteria bacterium]